MTEALFHVYSLTYKEWVSKTYSGTSEITKAQTFTLVDALDFCRVRFTDEHVCFPVAVQHLKTIEDMSNVAR